MLTFDGTHEEHFPLVGPILDKYNNKAVFFVTAVRCINNHSSFSSETSLRTISSSNDIDHWMCADNFDNLPLQARKVART
jgi:peptidoglycan/xylan/chitin deacetylase (PgdA/CDA1 family)